MKNYKEAFKEQYKSSKSIIGKILENLEKDIINEDEVVDKIIDEIKKDKPITIQVQTEVENIVGLFQMGLLNEEEALDRYGNI